MSAISSIQWTDRTWNPVRGCSVISPGCVNCYAMKLAHRFSGVGRPYEGLTKQTKAGPQWTGVVRTVDDVLLEPLSWRKPARVFVNSMSDLFHEDVPDEFIERVFSVMALADRHTFQVLTKRPERMRAWFAARRFDVKGYAILHTEQAGECRYAHPWPLPNVWLGVSIEDQPRADERIQLLLQTPAAVRFVSAEPLLGPLDLPLAWLAPFTDVDPSLRRTARLHWVIVGGESGPDARPFDLAWARSIVQQCKAAGVACFVKQIGARPLVPACRQSFFDFGRFIKRPEDKRFDLFDADRWVMFPADKKGGNPSEWPEDIRVREWPTL